MYNPYNPYSQTIGLDNLNFAYNPQASRGFNPLAQSGYTSYYGAQPPGQGPMGGMPGGGGSMPTLGYGGPTGAQIGTPMTDYQQLPDWMQQYAGHYLAGNGQSDVSAVNMYNELMKGRPQGFTPYAYTQAGGGYNGSNFDIFHSRINGANGAVIDPITGTTISNGMPQMPSLTGRANNIAGSVSGGLSGPGLAF